MKITTGALSEAINEFYGYCQACDTITEFGGVDPDATHVRCPDCGRHDMMGASEALIQGFVVVVNESDPDPKVFKL